YGTKDVKIRRSLGSGMASSDDGHSFHRALDGLAVDRDVEVSARHGEREHHAAFQPSHQLGQERALHAIELELRRPVDALAGPLADHPLGILVGIDDDTRSRFAGLVHPCRIGGADVDPYAHRAREITDRKRRLLGLGQAVREADAVNVFEAVGENAREEILLRLRRMPCDAEGEGFVDTAIDVSKIDLKGVYRRGQRSSSSRCWPACCACPTRSSVTPTSACSRVLGLRPTYCWYRPSAWKASASRRCSSRRPELHARASAAFMRSGVSGTRRKRTPVASKIAFAIAAGTVRVDGSPAPEA